MHIGGRPEALSSVFCNFSCNSAVAPDYFNVAGTQLQVTINSGVGGLTNVGTLEKAAKAFLDAYVKTQGTTKQRADAGIQEANRVIANSKLDEDQGDSVVPRLRISLSGLRLHY
jgi:hypothetical protein